MNKKHAVDLEDWIRNHMGVFNGDTDKWWYLQNCLGTMGIVSLEELRELELIYNTKVK